MGRAVISESRVKTGGITQELGAASSGISTLSFGDVEDLLAEPASTVPYETIRRWVSHSEENYAPPAL